MRVENNGLWTGLSVFLTTLMLGCSAQGEGAGEAEEQAAKETAQKLRVESKPPLYQVGPWVPAAFNLEEPYINIFYASDTYWKSKNFDTPALWEEGYLDDKTGLPKKLPNGETLTTGQAFFPQVKGAPEDVWDGDWIVDWRTADGECSADIHLLYLERELIKKSKPCRIEFTRDRAGGRTKWHVQFQIKRLKSPLTSFRVYRAENEAALNAGMIYSSRFLEAVKMYDIIRDMDLSQANKHGIRFADSQATMAAANWNNFEWMVRENYPAPFRGKPLEATFAMGVEAGAAVWAHAPLTLGSPVDIYAPEIYDANAAKWLNNITAAVRENRDAIIASEEWDKYADTFVSALDRSGYPESRILYVTLANEVWNYAGAYNYTTRYAGAIGPSTREAYGVLTARFASALIRALEASEREQRIVFVVEGQTANPATTSQALKGAKDWLEANGHSWDHYAPLFGVSVASYWGAHPPHMERAGVDPNDLKTLENYITNGPENDLYTLNYNVKFWKMHAAAAAKFGVKLIGAYEGGSHFTKPKSMTQENFEAFNWGEPGGRVNAAVNRALAEAFPGTILSNYALAGPAGGQPWFEGPLGVDNPYSKSWKKTVGE